VCNERLAIHEQKVWNSVFGLFKKRIPTYPNECSWTVSKGLHGGQPIVLRVNADARQLAGHAEYKFRIGVAVPLRCPGENGLPTPEENLEINAIEDLLCEGFERDRAALHAVAIATQGMKEFVFYTKAPKEAAQTFEEIRTKVTTHELQCVIAEDGQWSVYKQLAA
jgi:hypothetical protein